METWKAGRARYYQANKMKFAASEKEKRDSFREKIDALKLERGCADCGYCEHAVALDFDHLPGTTKLYSVSRMASHTWDRVEIEMKKCEIVCSNCHRVRTHERRK